MTPGRRDALILAAAGVLAAAGGFVAGPIVIRTLTGEGAGAGSGLSDLLSAPLTDLAGKPRQLIEWRDRILVCNFWATWCAPCREEVPLLVATREKYLASGLEVAGIAIDNADKVREFAAKFNISYPILMAEAQGLDLMRNLGNRQGGLPYTVVVNRGSTIAAEKLGAFKAGELDVLIRPLLTG